MATRTDPAHRPASYGLEPHALWERVAAKQEQDWRTLRARVGEPQPHHALRLCMVRHGETTTNARGLVTGTTDAPLTPRGRDQAVAAGRKLRGRTFDLAIHSPLRRSQETLAIVLRNGPKAAAVMCDKRIAERSLGAIELTEAAPIAAYARGDLLYAPDGGEDYLSVARRCFDFLLDLRDLAVAVSDPLSVLVCTHVGPMRVLDGILTAATDATDVLAMHFNNSSPAERLVGELTFPPFVEAQLDG